MPARRLGEGALDFARWFRKSKFQLMAEFLSELDCAPTERDAAAIRDRFHRALRHARRVLVARLFVTLLLAAGVVATLSAWLARVVPIPSLYANDVETWVALGGRVAAVSGSLTIALVVVRLAFDRYLELVDTSATFLAIELATARCAAR